MGVREGYNSWAATYDTDRNLTRDLDARATREVLADVRPTNILELGCGTGKNTAFLVEVGRHVHALDFSEEMIAQAKAKLPNAPVTFTRTDLTTPWPSEDGAVDLIVCNLVLEHIETIGFIFAEAARVLAPEGYFFVSELHPFKQYTGSQAVIRREGSEARIPAFTHHISEFYDAARQAGFSLVDLKEWWHEEDENAPPRLVTFLWKK